jgi:hypothetical protein
MAFQVKRQKLVKIARLCEHRPHGHKCFLTRANFGVQIDAGPVKFVAERGRVAGVGLGRRGVGEVSADCFCAVRTLGEAVVITGSDDNAGGRTSGPDASLIASWIWDRC